MTRDAGARNVRTSGGGAKDFDGEKQGMGFRRF
jgi:hypothetical protein